MAQDPPPSMVEKKNNSQLAMGSCNKYGKGGKAMATTIRVAGSKEGNGNKKGDGVNDREGDGFSGKSSDNKVGRQATAIRAMAMVMATTWAMVTVTRVVGKKEDNGNGIKSNGDGDEGGGQATATRAMATAMVMTWAMAMVTRLVGSKEGKAKGRQG